MAKGYVPRVSRRRISLTNFEGGLATDYDEDSLPIRYAKNTYNFSYNKGALRKGLGVDEYATLPNGESARGFFWYKRFDYNRGVRDDRLLVFCTSGRIFARGSESASFVRVGNVELNGVPRAVNYRLFSEDVVLICSEQDNMLVWDGINDPYYIVNSPFISSMTIHNERLFATVDGEKSAVWFSQDLNPTNWEVSLDGGGFIQMMDERGALNKVISYQNYVFVFRDNGISRISAYGGQEDFSVAHLFSSGGVIYPETVCLCGEYILFLSQDGIYCFNGADTYKLCPKIADMLVANENAVAAYCNGSYYLAVRARFADEERVGCEAGAYVNNALIRYSMYTKEVDVCRGIDIASMYALLDTGELIAYCRGSDKIARVSHCGKVFGNSTKKVWVTPKSDLGILGVKKTIRNIFVRTETDLYLTVTTEKQKKRFFVRGGSDVFEIKTSIRCSFAEFGIECWEEEPRILGLSVVVAT